MGAFIPGLISGTENLWGILRGWDIFLTKLYAEFEEAPLAFENASQMYKGASISFKADLMNFQRGEDSETNLSSKK